MKTKLILIFCALVITLIASTHEKRTWTDQKGRAFTGTMLSTREDTVLIERSSDKLEFEIKIEQLSKDDQLYIASIKPLDPCRLGDPTVANLIDGGDFERSSTKWDFRNQKKAFRRASAKLVEDYPNETDLGGRVLQVDRTEPDENHQDGPPYVTQIVKFKNKPERVLVCLDALYVGSEKKIRRGIRLSATDPNVKYMHVYGNTFPYTYRYIKSLGAWHHFEWVVELDELDNDSISFGFMLTHEDDKWYLDNISVKELRRRKSENEQRDER